MAVTRLTELRAPQSRAYIGSSLPSTPQIYYSTVTGDVNSVEWRGGEMAFNTTTLRMYIQSSTSGAVPHWKQYSTAFIAA